jgi:beta-glucanase (GH16 family)
VKYDDSVLLTMAPNTVGTLLMSSHYVWYGKISATMKTSQGSGVITAFILMSDMKDEIDFEFVGINMNTAETNYYYQGITNCKYPPHVILHRMRSDIF